MKAIALVSGADEVDLGANDEATMADMGLDSLDIIEVAFRVERQSRLDIELTLDTTLGEVLDSLTRQRVQSGA